MKKQVEMKFIKAQSKTAAELWDVIRSMKTTV